MRSRLVGFDILVKLCITSHRPVPGKQSTVQFPMPGLHRTYDAMA